MIKKGSVIQINEEIPEWCGCLLVVDEIKPFGCLAYMRIPGKGNAFIRLNTSSFDYIGESYYALSDDGVIIHDGTDVDISKISGCESKSMSECESSCSKYYRCETIAYANDLLRDFEAKKDTEEE